MLGAEFVNLYVATVTAALAVSIVSSFRTVLATDHRYFQLDVHCLVVPRCRVLSFPVGRLREILVAVDAAALELSHVIHGIAT